MSTQTGSELSSAELARRDGGWNFPRLQEFGLVVVIIVLGLIITNFSERAPDGKNLFLSIDNLLDGVATPMSVYAIMAVGVTFVIITGGIDISVGAIYALSALGAASVLQHYPIDAPSWKVLGVALLIAPGIGLLCGCFNGLLVTGLRMHPFIVTLGTMGIFRGIANVAPAPQSTIPYGENELPAALTDDFMRRYFFIDAEGLGGYRIMPLLIMLAVAVVGGLFLSKLVGGRETYAVGGNEEAARFSGLRVNWIKMRVYALSGLCAGIAAFVHIGRFGTVSTNTGEGYELTVIAAAVVGGASLTGGRGTALGALLGALVIRMIESGIFTMRLDQNYSRIIIGAAIIIAVAIDRLSEQFGRRRAR